MITNTGKSIITKYLLGQTPAYASHIAIGCGTTPLSSNSFSVTNKAMALGVVTLTASGHTFVANDYVTVTGVGTGFDGVFQITSVVAGTSITYTNSLYLTTTVTSVAISPSGTVSKNYSTKSSLDFEMFRVPITSRGYVTETDSSGNTVSKIVLTAQLPTEERYEITEFGIYPSNANPTAGNYDSKTIFSFSTTESWVINSTGGSLPIITTKLDSVTSGTIAAQTPDIFNVGSDNTVFNNETRLNRQERCRFYNNIIMMGGDTSTLTVSGSDMTATGNFIKLTSFSSSLANNSPTDELRLAFSVINRVASASDPTPANNFAAKILIKFKTSDSNYASFWVNQSIASGNRYYVVSKKLQDIYKSSANFSWSLVNSVEIYSSVVSGAGPSVDSNYYIGLDALRLENTASTNPLYGLVGYTPVTNVVNGNARPIVKNANTSNFVEFRFVADVV